VRRLRGLRGVNARENGAGEQQGLAGGLGSYLSRPRSGGGRSHDARRGQRLLRRRARTVPSHAGKGMAPTCGAGRSAAASARKAQRRLLAAVLGRQRCWASGWRWAKRGMQGGRRAGPARWGAGPAEGKPAGRNSRREREENDSFFSFSTIFQIHF